jgi:hypothetical protein
MISTPTTIVSSTCISAPGCPLGIATMPVTTTRQAYRGFAVVPCQIVLRAVSCSGRRGDLDRFLERVSLDRYRGDESAGVGWFKVERAPGVFGRDRLEDLIAAIRFDLIDPAADF